MMHPRIRRRHCFRGMAVMWLPPLTGENSRLRGRLTGLSRSGTSLAKYRSMTMDAFAAPADRRRSVSVKVGRVEVGGSAPVVVQSMTNTDTADAAATARQVAD